MQLKQLIYLACSPMHPIISFTSAIPETLAMELRCAAEKLRISQIKAVVPAS